MAKSLVRIVISVAPSFCSAEPGSLEEAASPRSWQKTELADWVEEILAAKWAKHPKGQTPMPTHLQTSSLCLQLNSMQQTEIVCHFSCSNYSIAGSMVLTEHAQECAQAPWMEALWKWLHMFLTAAGFFLKKNPLFHGISGFSSQQIARVGGSRKTWIYTFKQTSGTLVKLLVCGVWALSWKKKSYLKIKYKSGVVVSTCNLMRPMQKTAIGMRSSRSAKQVPDYPGLQKKTCISRGKKKKRKTEYISNKRIQALVVL